MCAPFKIIYTVVCLDSVFVIYTPKSLSVVQKYCTHDLMHKNILLNIPPVEAGIRTSETKICTFSGVAAQWFYKSLHPV